MLEDFFTLTEMKDGISTVARIGELISEIQKQKNAVGLNTADLIRQCSMAANTLASTKNEMCLQHVVQLNGVGFLNQWLQDAQNCGKDISNSAEDLIVAILTALECLPVDNAQSISCGVLSTVQHLLAHGNTKINQKARVLCQKWSSIPNCSTDGQDMDTKEACRREQQPAAAESSSRQQDSQWLTTLSEPELDLLISLKELAATRAKNAGHPRLADKFDLRTLRALGIVLLQNFKERLKVTSVDRNIFDRLALLSDSDADCTNSGSDSEVVRPNKDQETSIGVERIRREMQDGWHEEVVQSQKKRKMSERR